MTTCTFEQLTDDEILNAIESFGMHGAPLNERLATRIVGEPNTHEQRIQTRRLAGELLWAARDGFMHRPTLFEKTYLSLHAKRICLDEEEWALRLEGKGRGEVAVLLRGTQ